MLRLSVDGTLREETMAVSELLAGSTVHARDLLALALDAGRPTPSVREGRRCEQGLLGLFRVSSCVSGVVGFASHPDPP